MRMDEKYRGKGFLIAEYKLEITKRRTNEIDVVLLNKPAIHYALERKLQLQEILCPTVFLLDK